jgi:hypothetical protein
LGFGVKELKKSLLFLLFFFSVFGVFSQAGISVSGLVEWDTLRFNAQVSLDLASAGLRLPAGRTHGETLLAAGFHDNIRPYLMDLQVDSSTTIGDLVYRGELDLREIDAIILGATSVPPALSPDLHQISSSHTISLLNFNNTLLRHSRLTPIIRTLNPVSTASYTGIIIIATDILPIHGMRNTALPIPCLFPKIWDSEMNLIYERSMLEAHNIPIVRYSSASNIFQNNPTGLSPELREIVGDRPLRIFAQGVFGIKPTDLIIDQSDALLIISSGENRRLLSQGRIVIILDESVLRYEFTR